ncbi:MAG TPA: PAS domain-containing protein, partial [Allocoleopsis sp.]
QSLQQVNQELQQLNQELECRVALRIAELQHINQQLQAEVQEKQQTQEALRQSQAQLHDVLNSAIAVITRFRVFADCTWEYDFHSAGCETIFGYMPEELKTNKHLWMSRLHPDDRAQLIPFLYKEIFAGKTTTVEYRFYHKDGSLRWLSVAYASRWNAAESCWIVTAVNTDITERKQAEHALLKREQQLSLALDAAKAGLWEWDISTNKTYWSETNYKLLGYDPACKETTFEMWLNVVHPDDRARVLQQIQTVLEQRIDFQLEYRVVLPNGTLRWVNDLGKITYDAAGQPKGMIGIQIDVTESAQIKQALCLSNQRKDDFLSTVSHRPLAD